MDPWQPVDRAVITHAHGDHARWGSRLPHRARGRAGAAHAAGAGGAHSKPCFRASGSTSTASASRSIRPATSSARRRSAWNTPGKCGSCRATTRRSRTRRARRSSSVRCQTFITESTFGLPIYRWAPQNEMFAEIRAWWGANRDSGRACVLFALRARQGAAAARRAGGRRHRARSSRTARWSG